MTMLMYNGVTLPYPYTTDFRQEAVLDEMGGTDWYCTKFDVTVQTLINSSYISMLGPEFAPMKPEMIRSAADIMNVVRAKLLQPRREFSITSNGVELIPKITGGANLPAGTVDVKNGPKPQFCNISQLTNNTFLLTYRIIAHYWENNDLNLVEVVPVVRNFSTSNVLYNRWVEVVEFDKSQYSTLTRTGKYVIRSDTKDGKTADEIRTDVVKMSLRAGFVRESSRFSISADGLTIDYVFVDKEVYKVPPPPAFECDGEYIETSSRADAKRYGQVRVWLRGDKTTNQVDLMNAAIAIAVNKLTAHGGNLLAIAIGAAVGAAVGVVPVPAVPALFGGGFGQGFGAGFEHGRQVVAAKQAQAAAAAPPATSYILESAAYMMKLFDNSVEVNIRVMYPQLTGRKVGIAGFSVGNDSVLGSDRTSDPPSYLLRGTADAFLRAATYGNPSEVNGNVIVGIDSQKGFHVGRAGKFKEP